MNENLALLYLGAFTPNLPGFQNPATSTAGNIFQLNFLSALANSALPKPTIYSYFPIASFPRVRRLFVRSQRVRLETGLEVTSLPHVNLGAIKILTLGLSASWKTLRWWLSNRRAARKVVICYNLTAPPAWPIELLCRVLKVDFVPFIGDIYVPGEVVKNTFLRRLEFALQRRVIPKAHGLLVANPAILEDFAPDSHALLVEGGVMQSLIERFAETARVPDGTFHIVFAGQLSVLNGVTMLIEAMRLIDNPNVRVSILGGGEYAEEVCQAAKGDPRITYLGLCSHPQVLTAYEQADLLLNLRRTNYRTHRYVFPSKVVECLATGRPLLTTCTGHVTEEFGDFVFALEQETPEALAWLISQISEMDPELRSSYGQRAQRYVRENKTWEAHTRRLSLYLEEFVFTGAAA